jgi:hypothetical protein
MKIKSKLNRRITIPGKNKSIVMLAKGIREVDQKDINESPLLQQLIERGDVVILGEEKKVKKESSTTKEKDKQ